VKNIWQPCSGTRSYPFGRAVGKARPCAGRAESRPLGHNPGHTFCGARKNSASSSCWSFLPPSRLLVGAKRPDLYIQGGLRCTWELNAYSSYITPTKETHFQSCHWNRDSAHSAYSESVSWARQRMPSSLCIVSQDHRGALPAGTHGLCCEGQLRKEKARVSSSQPGTVLMLKPACSKGCTHGRVKIFDVVFVGERERIERPVS